MEKEQILTFIKSQIEAGKVSKDEVLAVVGSPIAPTQASATISEPSETSTSNKMVHVFYGIGMVIAIIGVIILIAQNWREIGFAGRVIVTLGIAFATYIAGLLAQGKEHRVLSQVMFTISAILAPLGVYVVLSESGIRITTTTHLLMSLAMVVVYSLAHYIARRNILTILITIFATWAYFASLDVVFGRLLDEDIWRWAIIVLGFAYLCVSYGLNALHEHTELDGERKSVRTLLSSAGTLAILGAGITFGGFGDMVYILVLFGTFYASIFLKNSSMLVLGAIFLMAHIVKLTSKYFVDSIGWPIALVLCGFIIIGIGYFTFTINKRYIKAV